MLFFTLYALTAQRGVSWQDSGEFQYRLLVGDYFWNSGIARAHPLYILLGRGFIALFPHLLKLYACSMFSGLCMALALSTLFLLVQRITSSLSAAFIAVATAGFSHMLWWMSTVTEVYALSLLFLMGELCLLLLYTRTKRASLLILLFAVNGAHLAVHNVALLGLPVYGVLLILFMTKDFKRHLPVAACAALLWGVAGGMIWWQAAGLLSSGTGVAGTLESVLFGEGYRSHVTGVGNFNSFLFFANMALAAVSFVSPCWLFAPAGMLCKKSYGNQLFFRVLAALTLIHFLFWIRYFVPDQATFILPLIGLLAVWVGVGCNALRRRFRSGYAMAGVLLLGVLLNLCILSVAPSAAKGVLGSPGRSRVPPGRDEWGYWLYPWKHNESSAQRFVKGVSSSLGFDDILYADSTSASPLMAFHCWSEVECQFVLRSPWTGLACDEGDRALDAGDLYVVSPVAGYVPLWLLGNEYKFMKSGVVYKVQKTEDMEHE